MKDSISKAFKEETDKFIGSFTSKCRMNDKLSDLINKDHKNCIIKPSEKIVKTKYLKYRFDYFEETAIKIINNDRFIEFVKAFTRIFWLSRIKFNLNTDKVNDYTSIDQYKVARNLIVTNFYNYLNYWSAYFF